MKYVEIEKLAGHYFLLFSFFELKENFSFHADHALLGHVMSTAVVADEFECQLKCMGNNSCKSCNVHPGGNNGNRTCDLNNKTRQMKPGNFKWKKGSTY